MSQCFHPQHDCSVCKKWPELNGGSKTCCSLTRVAVDANGEWLANVCSVRSVLYFLRMLRTKTEQNILNLFATLVSFFPTNPNKLVHLLNDRI